MKETTPAPISRRELIRAGSLVASGCALLPWTFAGAAETPKTSGDADASNTWAIGNNRIMRSITFQPNTGLFTALLSDLATQTDFILPGKPRMGKAQEFSFQCDGQDCAGNNAAFDLLGADEISLPNGKSLTVRLRHKLRALEVAVVYVCYIGHPAMRKHLVLRNTGTRPLHISHLNIESISVVLGPANENTLLTQYGTVPRETYFTGRSEDVGLLVTNGLTGNGIAVLSEVPGTMKRTEIDGFYGPDQARINVLYDTDLMPFERTIAPGEAFTSASASLLAFRKADGFNDPQWLLPSYTAQILERRVDRHGPPWIYNTWEPFHRRITAAIVLELVEAAGAMSMEIFTLDDGWQKEYGENTVDLAAFPDGLQPILEAVEANGMRLGLWFPLAAIGTSTPVYLDHPEWAACDQEGKPKITVTAGGPKAVMCMASAFRETAANRVLDAIDQFRLAYVKLDLTTIFNAYGEAPGCWAKGHDHSNWAESLNRIYEGISYVTQRIFEKHPEVLVDLTFELWGQKHIIDAGLLAAGDLDWMSNVDDSRPDSPGPLQARQLLYQRAATMPAECMLIGNLRADLPNRHETFATAIGSAPVLLGDLRSLPLDHRQWYHEKISWFRKLRRTTKISESFFPLGSWLQTSPAAWDGFARLAHNGNGVISLFRNKCKEATAIVKLPLIPAGRYRLHSVLTGHDLGVFEKSDWVRGIPIQFVEAQTVEVLEVIAVNA